MAAFGPGAWAGVNDAFAIAREKEQQDLLNAQRRQQIARGEMDMRVAQEDRQRQMRARGNAGRGLYDLVPPPVGGQQGPGPQPPMPGTSSAPPQPPGPPQGGPQGGPPQGGQGQLQSNPPQMMSPQGGPMRPPGMPQGGPMAPPGMGGGQPDPRALEVNRCKMDLQALDREMQRPGLSDEQKSILNAEKVKTQERLAQLTGQPAPYRSIPDASAAGAGGPPPMSSPGAPPPVGGGAQPQQGNLLMQIIAQAKKNGVPPEDLMDVVDTLNPVLKNQLQEEIAQMRGTQAANSLEIRALKLGLEQQRLAQNAERIAAAKKRAEQGAAPTSSELQDPETARIFYDIYKTSGKTPPFAWGKAGEADRQAWMKAVKQFSKDDGQTGGDVAGGQADAKANAAALTQNTKDLAAIEPYKVMLDKNANKAIELGAKVKLANSKWANQPIQYLQKNGASDPDLREYLAQIQIVQTEAARVLNNPRLTGQLTDSARHEMQDIIDGRMPLADTERVLRRMMADGENRVKALRDQNEKLKRGAAGKGAAPAGDDQDAQAIAWAKANPKDPRAAQILKLHGM